MIVVADTSPLTNLYAIGRLDLVRQLFGKVLVPPEVVRELASPEGPHPLDVREIPWIEVRAPEEERTVDFDHPLDAGEEEAILLALEIGAVLILIDEEIGRIEARRLGLRVMGLLGMLPEAKRQGLLGSVRVVIDQLEEKTDFRMKEELIRKILEKAGELPDDESAG